jgi:hypothetical protein
MATIRTILTSIDDADFDRVYDSSRAKLVDALEASFPFDAMGPTPALDVPANQKAHIRSLCQGKIDDPNGFCFKSVKDGVLIAMVFGTLTDGTLLVSYWLAAPDTSGSKAFAFDKAQTIEYYAWLKSQGVARYESELIEKGTTVKNWIESGETTTQDTTGSWGIDDTIQSTQPLTNYTFRKMGYDLDHID